MTPRAGGRILVEQLLVHGADCAFTVPGESFLPVLDAFYDVQDRLKLVVCRHEAAAANMAEALGKLTNRPGLCFVTRGPGATHAAIGVHTAFQDSTPMTFSSVPRRLGFPRPRGLQEVDFVRWSRPAAKWRRASTNLVSNASGVRGAAPSSSPPRGGRGPVCWRARDLLFEDGHCPPLATTPSARAPRPRRTGFAPAALAASLSVSRSLSSAAGMVARVVQTTYRVSWRRPHPPDCAFRYQISSTTANALRGRRRPPHQSGGAERVRMSAGRGRGARGLADDHTGYTLLEFPGRPEAGARASGAEESGHVYLPIWDSLRHGALRALGAASSRSRIRCGRMPSPKRGRLILDRAARDPRARADGGHRYYLTSTSEDTIVCNGAGNFATRLHRSPLRTGLAPRSSHPTGAWLRRAVAIAADHAADAPVVCFAATRLPHVWPGSPRVQSRRRDLRVVNNDHGTTACTRRALPRARIATTPEPQFAPSRDLRRGGRDVEGTRSRPAVERGRLRSRR